MMIMSLLFMVGCSEQTSEEATVQEPEVIKKAAVSFDTKPLEALTDVDNVMEMIEELASEKYMGRYPGEEGNDLAADYIASKYKEFGFTTFNGDDDYLDPFQMYVFQNEEAPILVTVDENGNEISSFKYIDEFTVRPWSRPSIDETVTPVIYDGTTLEAGDIFNRVVMVPYDQVQNSYNQDFSGALAIVKEERIASPDSFFNHFMKSVYCQQEPLKLYQENGTFRVSVNQETYAQIIADIEAGHSLKMHSEYQQVLVDTQNVVGVIEGKNRDDKDDYIILTGHFDHLGDNNNGTYNAGALDNASGIALATEIGRVIKASNVELDATVIIVGFSGEEEGLLGSYDFAEKYASQLENAVVINFDMVGHKNDTQYEFIVNQYNTVFTNDLKASAKAADFSVMISTEGGSDHIPFGEKGIPALTVIEYEKAEYHHYTDTIDKIEPNDYPPIANMMYNYLKTIEERGE